MENEIGKMKVSVALPLLQIAVIHYGLRLSFQKDWNAAWRFVKNSIAKN